MDMRSHGERRRVPGHAIRLRKAFTLLEMMIVLLLVGILVALAMPYYGDWRNRVLTQQASSDIIGNEAVVETYLTTNKSLPNSFADMPAARKIDPWGRPYVYYNIEANGKGGSRKDHALNPLNADYDMYSVGPDGLSKAQITQKDSVDDVIRASNGGYVGIASGF
jgi:general secretion pathway protein G